MMSVCDIEKEIFITYAKSGPIIKRNIMHYFLNTKDVF